MSGQRGPDFGNFCLDGILVPIFLCSKLLQIHPIFQNLGLGGSCYMLLKLSSPASPLTITQYVTWWDPMWPRTCLSVRIGHLGAPSKPHGFVRMASGKRQFFPPKVSGWASGFFTYIRRSSAAPSGIWG